MSLSDKESDQFSPMTLNSLERFDQESSSKSDESDPDFNRFKMLFEKPKLEKEEAFEFKAIYDAEKERDDIFFNPLIKKKDDSLEKEAINNEMDDQEQHPLSEKEKEPPEPVETADEKGYRQGFEKGLEQGILQGQKQGYEDGFAKGEAEGFEQGEAQGSEKGHQQGVEKGFKEGEVKGKQEIREKAVEILNALEASLKTADQTLDLLVEKYEEKIIALIQKIAQKAIMARLDIDDEMIKPLILDTLKTLVQPEEVVLSVSLEDYDYIEMIKDEFFEQIDSLNSVSIRSDPTIKRGGCKIETNTGFVSTDLESRLDAIFDAFKTAGTK
ncbi:FliH/SctL family protein [Desulfobacula phenolica]|uniref:Flagellar assembly protein FliH n=1 Tax=Desulfobacula phenolica TaxID=90732 RepID=A0A1H2DSQ6_9BACT|nr:FliH/SctL family protein [Desulfobacula phenolica]SDT85912.1 flagellar assembly protein FliH [Desulfobacula phenolica]